MSKVVCSNEHFVLRVLSPGRHGEIEPEAVKAIVDGLRLAFDSIPGLEGTLFVTVVPGESIHLGGEDYGFAVYHEGLETIAISGLQISGEIDRERWLLELSVTAIHECVHHLQYLEGRLSGSEKDEEEAEEWAYKLIPEAVRDTSADMKQGRVVRTHRPWWKFW